MQAGATFMFSDRSLEEHLWVVISDPASSLTDRLVAVNFTTYRRGRDRACLLQPGDHPFVKHETVVDYGLAIDPLLSALEGLLGHGKAFLKEPVSAEVLARIRRGAGESPFFPEGCKAILILQGFLD